MDIPCNKERGDKLSFYIQVSNPKLQKILNPEDECLSDAIESVFLLNTENAIMSWNYISIPLSYKYDISYMMEDLLNLLHCLQSMDTGEMVIHWLPDTFRCNWSILWECGELKIQSHWECTVGHLEKLLNDNSQVLISIKDFVNEWKGILYTVIEGLESCGYSDSRIRGMRQLLEQYNSIEGKGILYKE